MSKLRERTVLLAIGGVISNVAALAVAIVLSRLLSKELYGTYRQAFFVYRFLLGVLALRLETSLLYFLPRARGEDRPAFVGQTFVVGVVMGTVIGLVVALGADLFAKGMDNPDIVPLLYLLAPYAVLNQITLLAPNAILATGRAGLVLLCEVLDTLIRTAAILVPFLMGLDLTRVFAIILGAEVLIACWSLIFTKVAVGVSLRGFRKSVLWEQFAYSWPLLAQSIIAVLNIQFDRAVIAAVFDPERFAEYTNGAMQIPLVMIAIASMNRAILPEMSHLSGQGRTEEMLSLWRAAAAKGAAVVFPVALFFLLCPDYTMVLLYGQAYQASAIPFAIYTAGLIVRIAYFGTVFEAIGRNRSQIAAAVVTLGVNVVLTLAIVYLGRGTVLAFAGPALGTAFALVACAGTLLLLVGRATGVPVRRILPLRRMGHVGLAALAAALAAFGLRFLPAAVSVKFALMACVFGGVYVALGIRLKVISPQDISFLRSSLRAVWRRLARGGRDGRSETG